MKVSELDGMIKKKERNAENLHFVRKCVICHAVILLEEDQPEKAGLSLLSM